MSSPARPAPGQSRGGRCGTISALFWADLPDHPRDLHQRRVGRVLEPGIGVGAPKIANRAIIGDIGAAIGAKPHIGRPVEPADAVRESLFEGLVVRKALQVQRGRLTPTAGKVEQLDLVTDPRG
jgi:hypothetical protein